MKREIVMFGSQILRKPCPPVKEVDDDTRALVSDLFDSMRAAEGVGLAAPQIGLSNASASSTSRSSNPNTCPSP